MTDARFLGPGRPETDLYARLDDLLALDSATVSARAGQLSYWALAPSAVRDAPFVRVGNTAGARFLSDSLFYVASQPSLVRLHEEVVAMVGQLVGGVAGSAGIVTVGGTESNALAMKAARDRARRERPDITEPEVVLCRTAHPSFHKAAHWLGLRVVSIPFAHDYRADVAAMEMALTPRTIMIVGSAPSYTHGVIDPIEDLAALARTRGLWFHVDACVGGIVGPYLRQVGARIPPYDLSIDGVSSISADLHKHAYTPVGISTLTFRDETLRDDAAFRFEDWPNGLHRGATFISSRSAAPLAGAWAVLRYLGDDGFRAMAARLHRSRSALVEGIRRIPDLEVCGDPQVTMWTFASPTLDMFAIAEGLEARGWNVSRTREPRGMHLIVDPFEDDRLIDGYLSDLADATADVRTGRRARSGSADATY